LHHLPLQSLQSVTRNEDEEATDCSRREQEEEQHRKRSSAESLLYIRLTDTVEVHQSVFAVPKESEDRIQHVLVGEDEVDGQRERQDKPASSQSGFIEKNKSKRGPGCAEEANQADDQADHHALGNQIA